MSQTIHSDASGPGHRASHEAAPASSPKASVPIASDWPTHADGTNKRVGDMTPEERRRVFAAAAERTKAEFARAESRS